MGKLRFAMFGTGFWAFYQLSGWYEAGGVECVALYNRTKAKAEKLAAQFGVPAVYDDPLALLEREQLDFVDICTNVETHAEFTRMAAERGLHVVCQKPMGVGVAEAESMVRVCREKGVKLLINENWRWQTAVRAFGETLKQGRIGKVFRARIDYKNSFPVFDNQPFLKELDQFILTDVGSHILDAARYLFGEAQTLYCTTYRVHSDIKGEDVATVVLTMQSGATVVCELSYATKREHDRFPETYIQVEGAQGFLELAPDFWIRETTGAGTLATRHVPPYYAWADPRYIVAHSSIVPCHANLIRDLAGGEPAETRGDDNLETCRLYYGAYESARTGQVLRLGG